MDGGVHSLQQEQDEIRTAYLEAQGRRVLRFPNQQVLNDLASVLTAIQSACGQEFEGEAGGKD